MSASTPVITLTAITGGIGSGKSVVSHVLRAMGFPVYDCDTEAKRLMDADPEIRRRIAAEVTPDAIGPDGALCRPAIAAVVFNRPDRLTALNAIVHSAVRTDAERWAARLTAPRAFIETAILYESGFDSLVQEVWEVSAPVEERISRVQRRSGLSREQILARIASQQHHPRPHHRLIDNSPATPLLPQILTLLS